MCCRDTMVSSVLLLQGQEMQSFSFEEFMRPVVRIL